MGLFRRKQPEPEQPQSPQVVVRIETGQPQQAPGVHVKSHSRRLPLRARSPEEQQMRTALKLAKLRAKIQKLTPPVEKEGSNDSEDSE